LKRWKIVHNIILSFVIFRFAFGRVRALRFATGSRCTERWKCHFPIATSPSVLDCGKVSPYEGNPPGQQKLKLQDFHFKDFRPTSSDSTDGDGLTIAPSEAENLRV